MLFIIFLFCLWWNSRPKLWVSVIKDTTNKQQTTHDQQPITDNRQPTTDNRQPTADNQ